MRDEIFKKPINKQFEFDEIVASVFDDMISRSVPFYEDSTNLIANFLSISLKKNAKVVDLGCSTANSLIKLRNLRDDLELVGIDCSKDMLELARKKSDAFRANIKFKEGDILKFDDSYDCVLLNYTLQFIRPIKREEFIKTIFNNLNSDGILILSEKLVFNDVTLNKKMIELYLDYKEKQGYSKYEIAQKRESLENILIPYTQEENIMLLKKCGFKNVECIFKYANFGSFIAYK